MTIKNTYPSIILFATGILGLYTIIAQDRLEFQESPILIKSNEIQALDRQGLTYEHEIKVSESRVRQDSTYYWR